MVAKGENKSISFDDNALHCKNPSVLSGNAKQPSKEREWGVMVGIHDENSVPGGHLGCLIM